MSQESIITYIFGEFEMAGGHQQVNHRGNLGKESGSAYLWPMAAKVLPISALRLGKAGKDKQSGRAARKRTEWHNISI